jgi:phytoene dehydrogenase-like protein
VVEAGDAVGGRVRTDLVDGFRCDRGFQLLNPAYPEVPRVLDLHALELRPFAAGVVAVSGGRRYRLADPRREPGATWATLRAPVGSPAEKAAFATWGLRQATRDVAAMLAAPDTTLAAELDAAHVTGRLRRGVVDQFLAGVLADDSGASSAHLAALLVRSFARGTPAVPAAGMQAVPDQLAAALPEGTVRLGCSASSVTGTSVATADGVLTADAVVVAADPVTAARLTGIDEPAMRGLTTFWHAADAPPSRLPWLHLDTDRRGPVVNTAVLSAAAPSYAPPGRHLVASTVLGAHGDADTERRVRHQLRLVYGSDPRGWELVTVHEVPNALPAMPPPLVPRRPAQVGEGLFVAGDHRDTASIQGALVSGRRVADAVLAWARGGSR